MRPEEGIFVSDKARSLEGIILPLAAGLFAQNPAATVVGRVLDISGAVVPLAELEIRSTDSNEVRQGVSNEKGRFTVPNLAPGPYEVVVSKEGFASIRDTSVTRRWNRSRAPGFRLEPGGRITQAGASRLMQLGLRLQL
jgi:hypothetical protein